MDIFRMNLRETVSAINKLHNSTKIITVRKIRDINDIAPSNRSKIRLISHALEFLVKHNILRVARSKSPKWYRLVIPGDIKLEDFSL
jgi:hypothetical protein